MRPNPHTSQVTTDELLEQMAQAIYREWFVEFRYPGHRDVSLVDSEPRPIPEGWRWVEMRELAYEVRRGVDPDSLDPETPYFGLEHMPERSIAISAWGKAADAGSRKYRFEPGEIIFGKIRPYFHKVGIPPVPGICSTDVIVIHPRERRLAGLVLAVVSSDPFVQHAVQTSQGTKMPRANWAVLERYPVAVPGDALLAGFDQHMSDTVSLIHALVMANRNLRITRDLLLPRLVSGEIDVSKLNLDGVVDLV
jgi:type I restriction enzyme, S subunit